MAHNAPHKLRAAERSFEATSSTMLVARLGEIVLIKRYFLAAILSMRVSSVLRNGV